MNRGLQITTKIFLVLLVLLFASSGCRSVTEPVPASTTPAALAVIATVSETDTPVMTPTPSLPPTVTPVPTLPIPSPTPTPIPTLTDAEVNHFLLSLTKREPGCVLPCLGGITPGFTPWNAINPFLLSRGSKTNKPNATSEAAALFPGFPENQHVLAWFLFFPQNDVVDSFQVKFQESDNQTAFQSLFEIYSPEKIIREHGQPSRVLLSSVDYTLGPLKRVGWDLWLFYDQQGFEIRYGGYSPFHPDKYYICPKIGDGGTIGQIYFDLRSDQSRKLLGREDDILDSYYITVRTFQQATGKTLEDFTQIFTQSDQPACFDTPRDTWK